MTYYSSCCGEEITDFNSDVDYCPSCNKECIVVDWRGLKIGYTTFYRAGHQNESDEEFFERKLAKTNNPLQKILIITIVSIVFIVLLIGVYVNNK